MSAISEFCEKRKISPKIEEIFTMYCRSSYASRFSMRNGETVKLLVSKMSEEQVLYAWLEFVHELRSVIEPST